MFVVVLVGGELWGGGAGAAAKAAAVVVISRCLCASFLVCFVGEGSADDSLVAFAFFFFTGRSNCSTGPLELGVDVDGACTVATSLTGMCCFPI